MFNLSLRAIKAWVGEFFTPGQIVGTRHQPSSCLVANYITSMYPNVENAYVYENYINIHSSDGYFKIDTPPEIRELIAHFDGGKTHSGARASTVLKLIRQVESKYGIKACEADYEQIAQPEREAETPPELVGTAPTFAEVPQGQAVLP